MYTYNDYWLAHHGVLGQKWGVRNGPPYPLGSDMSTGKRLKTGTAGETSHPKISNRKFKKALNYSTAAFAFETKHVIKNPPVKIQGIKLKTGECTIFEDVESTNPNYRTSENFKNNCRYCTYTYDMRCRGYDVQAKSKGSDKQYWENAGYGAASKIYYPPPNEDRWTGIHDSEGNEITTKPSKQQSSRLKEMAQYQFDQLPKNCRGEFVTTFWFDNECGHSLAFEKKDGRLLILDTQIGGVFDIDSYYGFTDRRISAFQINRLDNLDFYPDQIKRFCK